MKLARDHIEQTAVGAPITVGRVRWRFTRVLLPVGVGLWGLGISQTHPRALLPWGLLPDLPVAFWAGIALLVVSAATELAREHPSSRWTAAHAAALVLMLYGTAPLVYPEGRYSWLYKTAGPVQYVNVHGQLDRHIDIYQNWPGFFALAAWFDKVAGVASPLVYAKWAELAFEFAALPLLYLIFRALGLTSRQRWVAMLLYPAANWIGQDYFSPQALGALLSLGIMAIALRWLTVHGPAADGSPGSGSSRLSGESPPAGTMARRGGWPARLGLGSNAGFRIVLLLVYFVLTFTHQLSPYILVIQLGMLAVFGLLRPRWLPVALGAIAIGYLAPRFAFVNEHYHVLASVGKFLSNIAPPSLSVVAYPLPQRLIEHSAQALSLGIWTLAAVGAWKRRRLGRAGLAPALLAFSPVLVLSAGAYGHEGILRVYLFSLPWSAALAASALIPAPELAIGRGSRHAPTAGVRGFLRRAATWSATALLPGRWRPSAGTLRASLAIVIALALFFPAFFGDDSFNAVSEAEVSTVTSFLQNAPGGPIYLATDNAGPFADTARYNQFPETTIFGVGGLVKTAARPAIVGEIASDAHSHTHGTEPAYVIVTPSMLAYAGTYEAPSVNDVQTLLTTLAHSPSWKLVVHRRGTWIYELPPAVAGPVPGEVRLRYLARSWSALPDTHGPQQHFAAAFTC